MFRRTGRLSMGRVRRDYVWRPRRRPRRWLRRIAYALLVLCVVAGFKAVQNRRDVVPVEPLPVVLAALGSGVPEEFAILDPYAGGGEWYKVQLHTHTDSSLDGRWSMDESLQAYAGAGYDFVAITDHDVITAPVSVPQGLLAIPAEENTVSFPFWPFGQHAVYLFVDEHVRSGSARERFAAVAARGGIVSVAHPTWTGNLGSGVWEMRHLLATRDFRLMEVINPHSDTAGNVALWHELNVRRGAGNPVWGVGVDDAHDGHLFNWAWTMVKAERRSLAALKAALEQGSLYATRGPLVAFGVVDGAVTATAMPGGPPPDGTVYAVTFVGASGDVLATHVGPLPARYVPRGVEGFVRVEVRDIGSDKEAFSQPFWIVPGRGAEL